MNKQSGSILILVALMMFVLIGFMGLAVDVGFMTLQKTRLQGTADAETLASAINPASNLCPIGGEIFTQRGITMDLI